MIDPVSLIGVNVATGLWDNLFSSGQKVKEGSFDSAIKQQGVGELEKASELIGANVQVQKDDGSLISGLVEKIEISNRKIQIQVNGQSFGLNQIRHVLSKQA